MLFPERGSPLDWMHLHDTNRAKQGAYQMTAMTLTEAKNNLEKVINQVIEDAEPAIVCTESGQQVVVLPLNEFNSWKETIYLVSNPANAAHLRRSIQEARAGEIQEKDLISE
jgi:antitoxin YefM